MQQRGMPPFPTYVRERKRGAGAYVEVEGDGVRVFAPEVAFDGAGVGGGEGEDGAEEFGGEAVDVGAVLWK